MGQSAVKASACAINICRDLLPLRAWLMFLCNTSAVCRTISTGPSQLSLAWPQLSTQTVGSHEDVLQER